MNKIKRSLTSERLSDADQIALWKLGRFTEGGWELLKHALNPHLKLWSPSYLCSSRT